MGSAPTELSIEELTQKMWEICVHQNIAYVIGAGLNISSSAMQSINDRVMRVHFVASLRAIANKLESMEEKAH